MNPIFKWGKCFWGEILFIFHKFQQKNYVGQLIPLSPKLRWKIQMLCWSPIASMLPLTHHSSQNWNSVLAVNSWNSFLTNCNSCSKYFGLISVPVASMWYYCFNSPHRIDPVLAENSNMNSLNSEFTILLACTSSSQNFGQCALPVASLSRCYQVLLLRD